MPDSIIVPKSKSYKYWNDHLWNFIVIRETHACAHVKSENNSSRFNIMEFNECFLSGDAELMLQQSCGMECRLYQSQSYFYHSTPKEMASRITVKHSTPRERCMDELSDQLQNGHVKLNESTKLSNIFVTRNEPIVENREVEKRKSFELREDKHLYRTSNNIGFQPTAKYQKVSVKENSQNTPINRKMTSRSHDFEINHSTPKGVNDVLEEAAEEMLWTGASAKELQRVMSAPQLPGQSEFLEMNKLRHVTSLPQLWIPKYGNQHLNIWQRRLEVLNRRTEKMRKKDKILKDRLEVIKKRATMLANSPVNTPLKRHDERTARMNSNQYNDKIPIATIRKPKVKKQVVRHPNSVYSCTLAKLIIGSPLRTAWKDGQKCTYV